MLNLRRLQAMVLLVGVLVVSFGMFAPPAFSTTCGEAKTACCNAISDAQQACAYWGQNHLICYCSKHWPHRSVERQRKRVVVLLPMSVSAGKLSQRR